MTMGSDLYYVLDPRARRLQQEAIIMQQPVMLNGTFNAENYASYDLSGTFSFTQSALNNFNPGKGCYRETTWPWYQRPFPFWTVFVLVPMYCLFASLWKGQPFRSKHLPIMVIFACCRCVPLRMRPGILLDVATAIQPIVSQGSSSSTGE